MAKKNLDEVIAEAMKNNIGYYRPGLSLRQHEFIAGMKPNRGKETVEITFCPEYTDELECPICFYSFPERTVKGATGECPCCGQPFHVNIWTT